MPRKAQNISKSRVLPGAASSKATGEEVRVGVRYGNPLIKNATGVRKQKRKKKERREERKDEQAVERMLRSPAHLLSRQRGRANGQSDASIMGEFAKDARLYADSLAVPEMHLAVKVPDGKLEPSLVVHPEFEAKIPKVTGADGYEYAGLMLFDLTGATAYNRISAVDAAGAITWTAVAHPNAALLSANFGFQRMVSQSVQMFDTTFSLERTGEYAAARIMDLQSGSIFGFPSSWDAFVALPMTATLPNLPNNEGVRLTYLPGEADDQPYKAVTSITAQTGSILVIIWRSTSATFDPVARFFQNIECVPFADKSLIFSTSSDLGSPDALNRAVFDTAKMLSAMSVTISSFRTFMESPTGQTLLSAGRKAFDYLVAALGYGPSVRRRRVMCELLVAMETSMGDDRCPVLTNSELTFLKGVVQRILSSEGEGSTPERPWEQVSLAGSDETKSSVAAEVREPGPRRPLLRVWG